MPVTGVAGGSVVRWEDKSGNARHATQSTGVNQPTKQTGIKNGRDVVRFDGSNDFLSTSLTNNGTLTVFVVAANRNTSVGGTEIDTLFSSNNFPVFPNNKGISCSSANGYAGTPRTFLEETIPAGSFTKYLNGGGTYTTVLNQFFIGSIIYSGVTLEGAKTMQLGRLVTGAATFFGQNDIAEFLVFPTALSTSERIAIESYLNAKWAIY